MSDSLHGDANGRRDPRYSRVGAAVLGDDVAVQILEYNSPHILINLVKIQNMIGRNLILPQNKHFETSSTLILLA